MNIHILLKQYLSERDIADTSLRLYRYVIQYFFRWMVQQGKDAAMPGKSDVITYKRYMKDKGMASATVDLYINALKGFFKWLSDSGTYENITTGIRNDRKHKSFTREPLLVTEVNNLINSIGTDKVIDLRDRLIIALLYYNALRVIEVSRIELNDVDMAASSLFIQGKGQREKQAIDINSTVAAMIADYVQARADHGWLKGKYLFISHAGKSYYNQGQLKSTFISAIVSARLRDAGLKRKAVSAHSLRHSAAVHMINGGHDLYTVQLFLRHSDTNTSRIYTRYAEKNRMQQKAPTTFLQGEIMGLTNSEQV